MICESFWKELSMISNIYSVLRTNNFLYEIAKKIIDMKLLFQTLQNLNPQGIEALQLYCLIYRYILRDEDRFNSIVTTLNQLRKTNKLS